MRKILIFLLSFMIIGAASGLPLFGPPQGFRNNGEVELGALTIDGVSIDGGDISYDDLVDQIYVNETAINTSIDALMAAAYLNETAINSSIDTLTTGAYTNETAINSSIDVLTSSAYLNETVINATAANVALGQTAQNTTITNLGLGQTAQNTSLTNIGLGQTWQNTTLTDLGLGQTAQNVSITNLGLATTAINVSKTADKQSDYINQTAINSSISALVVPLATYDYDANSVDRGVFTASGGWVLTAVKMTPRVAGVDGSAVTVMIKICDSGEAPASGDNMLSGTLDLKGTADTPQSGTVSSGAIANGKIVALDFTGTLTSAVGTITLFGTRA
jgi:hypothetical protein